MLLYTLLLGAAIVLAAADEWKTAVEGGNQMLAAGRYREAEQEYRRALNVLDWRSKQSAELAATYNNLASASQELGWDDEAERLYLLSIRMWEGLDAPPQAVARPLNNLGTLYRKQHRLVEAERSYRRSLELRLKVADPDHPEVARVISNIGCVQQMNGNYADAEASYRRALAVLERTAGAEGEVAGLLSNLGSVQRRLGNREAARQMLNRALEGGVAAFGPDHPALVNILVNAAGVDFDDKQFPAAEAHLQRAKQIAETRLGTGHPTTASVLMQHAAVLRKLRRKTEAEQQERRAEAVLRSFRGSHTVDVSELVQR